MMTRYAMETSAGFAAPTFTDTVDGRIITEFEVVELLNKYDEAVALLRKIAAASCVDDGGFSMEDVVDEVDDYLQKLGTESEGRE